jgi:hypothetical protein
LLAVRDNGRSGRFEAFDSIGNRSVLLLLQLSRGNLRGMEPTGSVGIPVAVLGLNSIANLPALCLEAPWTERPGLDRTDWSVYIGLLNAEGVKQESDGNSGIIRS